MTEGKNLPGKKPDSESEHLPGTKLLMELSPDSNAFKILRILGQIAAYGRPGDPIANLVGDVRDIEGAFEDFVDTILIETRSIRRDDGSANIVLYGSQIDMKKLRDFAEISLRTASDYDFDIAKLRDGDTTGLPNSLQESLERRKVAESMLRSLELIELLQNGQLHVKNEAGDFIPLTNKTMDMSTDGKLYGSDGSELGSVTNVTGLRMATVDEIRQSGILRAIGGFFRMFDLGISAQEVTSALLKEPDEGHIKHVRKPPPNVPKEWGR